MNYLAHLFLAGKDKDLIYGNLLEDFLNGRIDHPRNAHLSQAIKRGVMMHRQIDSFTDTHPRVRASKAVFSPALGRYAAIAIDVVFDHFLLKNWSRYTHEDFEAFRKRIYTVLEQYTAQMPDPVLALFVSMKTHDWLAAYAYDEGLSKAFSGLNKKVRNGPDLLLSIPIMHEHYTFLNAEFVLFFDEMYQFCKQFQIENT